MKSLVLPLGDKRNVMNCLVSVCLSHLFLTLIGRAACILNVTNQGGSMRRGRRTYRPDDKQDRHTCCNDDVRRCLTCGWVVNWSICAVLSWLEQSVTGGGECRRFQGLTRDIVKIYVRKIPTVASCGMHFIYDNCSANRLIQSYY